MLPGAKTLPSFEQLTSNPCLAPRSVRICSAYASLVGSSFGRVITLCWKPDDFVKNNTFFRPPPAPAACPNARPNGAAVNAPAAARPASFNASRRLMGLCMAAHPTRRPGAP
jgi:hypothetical protein